MAELLPSGCIITDRLPAAFKQIFVCNQAFQADRAAGVQFAGTDTDFSAKPVAIAVREAGGTVPVYTGGVNHVEEESGSFIVFRDNRIGMM